MDNILKFNLFNVDFIVNNDKNQWDGGLGISEGNWEIETFKVLDYVKNKQKNAIDIGAWIGPISIWMSKNFKNILSIEPDVVALKDLQKNLKLSNCDNVWILKNPIFNEDSEIFFGPNKNEDWLNKAGLGESVSQTKLISGDVNDYKVNAISLSTLEKTINNFFPLSEVSFVKVDIEGGEEFILEELLTMGKKYKWSLLISFHIDWWENKSIERFNYLFNDVKEIRFNSIDFTNQNFDIIELLKNNPYASIHFKY